MSRHDLAVFIASSDNTQDVLQQVFPSLRRYWPNCPYPIYVGKNTAAGMPAGCVPALAPVGGWRTELDRQLGQVPASRVLLLLDDFLLTAPVRSERLAVIVEHAIRRELDYVRLRPLQRALLPALWARVTAGRELTERIAETMPYYSGLQPAIWRLEHLRECVRAAQDIWAFEHIVWSNSQHHAVHAPSPLECVHVVERGKWLPAAPHLFARSGLTFAPGNRQSWARRMQLRVLYGRAKFAAFGYTGVRLRRLRGDPSTSPRVLTSGAAVRKTDGF